MCGTTRDRLNVNYHTFQSLMAALMLVRTSSTPCRGAAGFKFKLARAQGRGAGEGQKSSNRDDFIMMAAMTTRPLARRPGAGDSRACIRRKAVADYGSNSNLQLPQLVLEVGASTTAADPSLRCSRLLFLLPRLAHPGLEPRLLPTTASAQGKNMMDADGYREGPGGGVVGLGRGQGGGVADRERGAISPKRTQTRTTTQATQARGPSTTTQNSFDLE